MADRLNKMVVLVGMMGCGKTAIGTELSRRLGVPFLDSDAAIVEAANTSIAEIFDRHGEAFFRDKETRVLARLLDGPVGVLSTGGGAFLRAENRALIDDAGVSVWLDAPLDLLWQRVRHKTTRPLLLTANPRATLANLFAERTPIYAKAALRVPTNATYSIADMTDAVMEKLRDAKILVDDAT